MGNGAKTRNGRIWINMFLLIVSLLLALFVAESFLKIRSDKARKELLRKYGQGELTLTSDEKLIYKGLPHKGGNNSQGYWDHEYSYAKDQGVYRLVVIGDSIAKGQGVKLEEGFSKLLEKEFNARKGSRRFEVIKLTQSGYSTSQELWLLKKEAFRYNPDAILWSYCLNDPADPVFHNANGELGRYFYVPKVHIFDLIRKGYFAFIEGQSIRDRKCARGCFDGFLHCAYWEQVQQDVREIALTARRHKTPVFFAIHPTFFQNKEFSEYPLGELHSKLVALASSNGLIPIDLLNCYKRYKVEEIRLQEKGRRVNCWHLSVQGHAAVADYLLKVLQPYLER